MTDIKYKPLRKLAIKLDSRIKELERNIERIEDEYREHRKIASNTVSDIVSYICSIGDIEKACGEKTAFWATHLIAGDK